MIDARGLARSFGGREVVHDVDLAVGAGEVVGFVGPNGAGKTTTMRCLLGVLRPDRGTVELDRPVGYLPENVAVYEQLSVRSHLAFVARAQRVAAAGAEIERVGSLLDLQDLMRRPIARLSRGQKQRVGLASALLGSPATLVLDEPTQGLDPAQIVDARRAIRDAASAGAAVLFSTHLLAEAAALCDRVVVLVGGRVVADVARGDFADLEDRFLRLVGEAALS